MATASDPAGAVLAIDFGTKRLGLAVSSDDRVFVFPRDTLIRATKEADFQALRALAVEDRVRQVALGLPLNADGSEGPMSVIVRAFGEELRAALGLPVDLVDERYTSLEADEFLREKYPRDTRKRKALRDRGAAVLILKTYLDHGPYRP